MALPTLIAGNTTAGAGTIITIAAGTTFYGTVQVSLSQVVAASGAAVNATAAVQVSGAGASPANNTILCMAVASVPAQTASSTGTAQNSASVGPLYVTAPAGNAVTLILTVTNGTTFAGSAAGIILKPSEPAGMAAL